MPASSLLCVSIYSVETDSGDDDADDTYYPSSESVDYSGKVHAYITKCNVFYKKKTPLILYQGGCTTKV